MLSFGSVSFIKSTLLFLLGSEDISLKGLQQELEECESDEVEKKTESEQSFFQSHIYSVFTYSVHG